MLVRENFAQEEIMRSAGIAASIYLNDVPAFVEEELQRLYGGIRSSLPYLQIFKAFDQVNTYVAWEHTVPTAVLLFRLQKRSVVVLNERIRISDEELKRFVACVFERFSFVEVIRFEAVQADLKNPGFPVQRTIADEDLIVQLPNTAESYTSSLRKKSRWHIKRKLALLKQDFTSIRFETYEKNEIDERLFFHLIDLKEERIKSKKQNFNIDQEHARKLMELAKLCGVFNIMWIDDELGAAVIEYRLGSDQDGELTVHDPKYDHYSLGVICNYLSICECITKGVKTYHFGAGRNPYKIQLGSVPHRMDQLNIYRSCRHMMLNGDRVVKVWVEDRIRKLAEWRANHEASMVNRLVFRPMSSVREIWKKISK